MKSTMMDFQLTLAPMLERAAKLYPKVEIVSRMPDRSLHRYTYSDLATRARKLARALMAGGLQRGERVATLMWNHSVHLEAYFGVPLAGGVTHTLNLRLPPNQRAFIAHHAEDRFLIVDEVLLPLLQNFISGAPFERVFVHRTGQCPFELYEDYEALLATAPDDCVLPQLSEYDAAAMCYTSGTTGDPKGVVYSHRALVLHSPALAMADCFAISHPDTLLPVVPMFHVTACGFPYVPALVGAKQVLPGPCLDGESLLDLCEREQVTLANGVPTVWMAVCAELDKNPKRWRLAPNLRLAVGGSAPAESLIRRFDAHGIRLIHAWGMTESTPIASVCHLRPCLDEMSENEKYAIRAMQRPPVPFIEARVGADGGEVCCDGKTMGEVQLRGPWAASSSYDMPELSDKCTQDDWLRTAALATLNRHAYFPTVDLTK